MNKEQEAAWAEAQKIAIGEDLISAAQRLLEFLAAVDRQRWLYDSPGLDRAIHRYKACWLPLLAKHGESGEFQGPLVVPLDCEWIWHCHRLNPVQYKKDCERVYGKILDSKFVESSIQTKSKSQSEEIWAKLYPEEPFELEFNTILPDKIPNINTNEASKITYDLVSAVKRQTSFYYQVSKPGMSDERMLTSALERYKGFLYLIKTIQEKSLKIFCVPTYDVDIMWHSHQLSPVSYCKDTMNLVGRILEHDDTDSDRSKGKKLDIAFGGTTKQFEESFGLRYWKAGVMYRGAVPIALTTVPLVPVDKILKKSSCNYLSLSPKMVAEVFLEIVDVRNLEINESETLCVSLSKNQADMFFNGNATINIFSLTGEKQIAGFECEPTGDLTLTLISKSKTNSNSESVLGTTSISLEELTGPNSKLSIERWLEVKLKCSIFNPSPIYLRVAASCTVPVRAPYVLNMVKHDNSHLQSCVHSIYGKDENYKYLFVDDFGNEAIGVHLRKNETSSKMEVIGITSSRKTIILAEGAENKWLLNPTCNFDCSAEIRSKQDGTFTCELESDHLVKLYWGKKLEYEEKCSCEDHNDGIFVTAAEFSTEHPYGKAIALLDLKSKLLKVNNEWFVLPWITLSSIFMDLFEKPTTKDESITNFTLTPPKTVPLKSSAGGCGSGCSGGCGGNVIPPFVASKTSPIKTFSGHRGGCCAVTCGHDTIISSIENFTDQTCNGTAPGECSRGTICFTVCLGK